MRSQDFYFDETIFNSVVSLRPLVEAMKKSIAEGKPGSQKLYGELLAEVESHPELLEPITNFTILHTHRELVEMLLSTIFPVTNSENENLYAVALPFKFQTIYSSRLFQQLFLKPGTNEINVTDSGMAHNLNEEKMTFAYGKILEKYRNNYYPESVRSVHPYTDPVSGVGKYLALKIDPRFIDVNPVGELPAFPEEIISGKTNQLMPLNELQKVLPLSKFRFEGVSIIRIKDVTEEEAISRMKNTLLHANAFSDAAVYKELQGYMQSLIGLQDIRIGITPFFKVNGHYVYSELHNSNSLVFKHLTAIAKKDMVGDCCNNLFASSNQPLVFETIDAKAIEEVEALKFYYEDGARSMIVCPLKHNGELIGILEIISCVPGHLKASYLRKIEPAIPLFTLAMEKGAETLNNEIDKVIKEKFTAVQPAVEWKFTDAAFSYILGKQKQDDAKLERIIFEDVYPLYAAIDIRGSSTERAYAIQLDVIDQLQMVKSIIQKAQTLISFPLLQEIQFKIDKYIALATDLLHAEDELHIHEFLVSEVRVIFDHIRNSAPSLRKTIADYFASMDPSTNIISRHRKDYEESIGHINDTLARFIDKEQIEAQKVYPHYFERFITDGVEFNVYIGQSIAPRRKFDELYLRNMKMWQLQVLAKAARITKKLETSLSHPLSTTQLILAHSIPISISFRSAERKFDVDGAYNIRYEIMKKRIDKVRIKNTEQRLTEPGKIAIVYSQAKEAAEYKEYIEFLQGQKLLKPDIEEFELEELQGVTGLRALRVAVEMNLPAMEERAPQLLVKTTPVSEN
jgi:hypothetical protein